MSDICDRLRRWTTAKAVQPAGDIMDEAADEIDALRAMLTRQAESAHDAVRMMGDYAKRFGFLLGGLEMVAAGHTTAEAVLAKAREKFGE
jgi:NaMN:DMB phosphoribosyltransferase